MKAIKTITALLVILFIFTNCGNNAPAISESKSDRVSSKQDTTRRIEILQAEALKLLDSSAVIEILEKGFKWTEGPLYIKDGDFLIFSDIPNNKIYKWKEERTQAS